MMTGCRSWNGCPLKPTGWNRHRRGKQVLRQIVADVRLILDDLIPNLLRWVEDVEDISPGTGNLMRCGRIV